MNKANRLRLGLFLDVQIPTCMERFVGLPRMSIAYMLLVMNQSFSLEKSTGKKCYSIAARDLHITWGDSPRYWAWHSTPDSRSISLFSFALYM